ncbi:MAG: hypothetical protein JSR76_08410 [Verrucomicrobia bacterium]|nr:hypothetical protein [Verrucomicrobiota bacterium]
MDACTVKRDFLALDPDVLQGALKRGIVSIDEQKNLLQTAIEITAPYHVRILLIGGAVADALDEKEKTRNFFVAVFRGNVEILGSLSTAKCIPEGAVARAYAAALLLKNPGVKSPLEPTVKSPLEPTVESLLEPTVESPLEPTVESLLEPKVEGLLAASIKGNPIAYIEELSEECKGTFFQLACKVEHVAFVRIIAPLAPDVNVERKYAQLVLTESPLKEVLQTILGDERSAVIEKRVRAFRADCEKARAAKALAEAVDSRLPCEGEPSDARKLPEEVAASGRAPLPSHPTAVALAPGGSSPKKPSWFVRLDRWLNEKFSELLE